MEAPPLKTTVSTISASPKDEEVRITQVVIIPLAGLDKSRSSRNSGLGARDPRVKTSSI